MIVYEISDCKFESRCCQRVGPASSSVKYESLGKNGIIIIAIIIIRRRRTTATTTTTAIIIIIIPGLDRKISRLGKDVTEDME